MGEIISDLFNKSFVVTFCQEEHYDEGDATISYIPPTHCEIILLRVSCSHSYCQSWVNIYYSNVKNTQ